MRFAFCSKVGLVIAATAMAVALCAPAPARAGGFDGMWGAALDMTFDPSDFVDASPAVVKTMNEIVKGSNLPANFVLKAVRGKRFNNAVALVDNGRVIIYGANYMQALSGSGEKRWGAFVILAHEIGHHLSGHTLDGKGSSHRPELEADYFAGSAVKRANGPLPESLSIYRLAPQDASATHPARRDRMRAFAAGWNSALALEERHNVVTNSPAPEELKQKGILAIPVVAYFLAGKIRRFPEGVYRQWSEYKWNETKKEDELFTDEFREIAREGTTIFLFDPPRNIWVKIEPSPTGGLGEGYWSGAPAPAKGLWNAHGGQWTPLNPEKGKK